MHSYGGQVGTNALAGLRLKSRSESGLSGGVTRLVYMCAFALPGGGSMVGKVRQFGHEEWLPLAFDFAEDQSVVCRDPRRVLVGEGGTVAGGEVEGYLASLVRWNGKCMYDEPTCAAAWREIRVSYIYTTPDRTVPLVYQESMVEYLRGQGREVQTFTLETGHCPNLTATQGVVDVILKIVVGS